MLLHAMPMIGAWISVLGLLAISQTGPQYDPKLIEDNDWDNPV